jgi:hypothetical protein
MNVMQKVRGHVAGAGKKMVFQEHNAGMNPYLCTPFVSSRINPGGQAESLLFIHF